MNDVWWTSPAESDGGELIMVTGRDKLQSVMDSGKYNYRVEVKWKYDSSGMPDTETSTLMGEMTDALQAAFSKDKVAYMTGIYTGGGQRDWVFYVKKLGTFQGVFNHALEELPALPITIEAFSDPNWDEYREMRENTYIPDKD